MKSKTNTATTIVMLATLAAMALIQPTAPKIYTGSFPNGLIVIEAGAIVKDADISNPKGVGLTIRAEGVTVDNVTVHDSKSHGILILASHTTIQNSTITHNVTGTCYPGCSGGWESGLKCQSKDGGLGLVQDVKILNNVIYGNLGEGMGLRCANILVQGNTVYDNFSFNIYFNSWDITIENNFVYCTGVNLRDGYAAAGIGGQEEGFFNWPKSAHDIVVRNNIVYRCKYGYRYGGAGGGINPGLVRANIYNNTFFKTDMSEISIVYAPAQQDVIIQDNIARRVAYDGRGAVSWNNVDVDMQGGYDPIYFKPYIHVAGELNIPTDFFGNPRSIFSVGAVEWSDILSTVTTTPTPSRTATATQTGTSTPSKTPAPMTAPPTRTPTITPTHATWTPSPTRTPTPTWSATPTITQSVIATLTPQCFNVLPAGSICWYPSPQP